MRHPHIALGAALALVTLNALADGPRAPATPSPAYQQECSSCHIAYPPGLLAAPSWQRIMDTLPRHYGTDASLDDEATRAQIAAWLRANAGAGKRVVAAPPEDRITRSPWFVRKHDEVPASAWTRPAVKSASNCAACHRDAERGDFEEDRVRIPR